MRDYDATYSMTLAEIGQELGVTRQRVRQIEQQALLKAGCAFTIAKELGDDAAPLLERLHGKGLRYFETAAAQAIRVQSGKIEPLRNR